MAYTQAHAVESKGVLVLSGPGRRRRSSSIKNGRAYTRRAYGMIERRGDIRYLYTCKSTYETWRETGRDGTRRDGGETGDGDGERDGRQQVRDEEGGKFAERRKRVHTRQESTKEKQSA